MKDLSSIEAESQVCKRVLIHLATGTTPTFIEPIPSKSDQPPSSAAAYSALSNNYTTQDEKEYNSKTDVEHRESLTVALSILLDSTSPGPDPLALQSLGWAYGGGGGGGMGDWDGCHYMPGSIGQTLRVLQDQVVLNLVNEYSSMANLNATDYLSQEKAWWLQSHEVEYGKGYERSATRFCTIGGVTPWTIPYTKGGVLWGPPIAGVCVPSSCTADGLYTLFDGQSGFADSLLNMATQDGFHDAEQKESDHTGPPTASRRFRYMSSLAQSFNAGRVSKMGVVCEGESGLPELDLDEYRSQGYYATLALCWILFVFVILGTISSTWILSPNKDEHEDTNGTNDATKEKHDGDQSRHFENNNNNNDDKNSENMSLMNGISINSDLKTNKANYGSNSGNNDNVVTDIKKDKSISFLGWTKTIPSNIESNDSSDGDYQLGNIIENEDHDNSDDSNHHDPHETFPLLQSDKEMKFISIEEKCGIELQRSASFSLSERRSRRDHGMYIMSYSISHLMLQLKSKFAYFDAGQSFYEITRLTREDPYVDSRHQQRLRKDGETSLDPSSSTTGLFPMYKALSRVRTRAIDPDYTVSVSSSKCLNAMRSISMMWIIVGHTLAVQSSVGYVNPAALLPPTGMMTSPLGRMILSARYAVDTFFFIGGFLVMSGLLKRLDPAVGEVPKIEEQEQVNKWKAMMTRWRIVNPKHIVIGEYVSRLRQQAASASPANKNHGKGFKWVIPFLLHRILRILPTYGFVLLLWWKIAVNLGDGPFWPRWATFVAQCDANAWTNMLFINNIFPRVQPFGETSECMYHAWYLGVDFQLCFFLAPIFVSLYLRDGWRVRTILLEALTIVGIITASLYCSFKYNWSAHLWDGADTGAFDRGFYINPFFRSSPYIIGFITGQIWHEKSRLCPNVGLTKIASILLSLTSIIIMVYWSIYSGGTINLRPCQIWESPRSGVCGSGWSGIELALFNSFGRPVWGLGLAIMSLLSFNGQLNFLWSSRILTWPGWDPMSKLSFSMYLLHPLVINVWVLGGDDKFRFSIINLIFAFAGILLITFMMALTIGIFVEWPISRITRDFEKKLWSRPNFSKTSGSKEETMMDNSEQSEKSTFSVNNDSTKDFTDKL